MAGAPEPWLEAAQDDATRLAIADMQNAGIDIITDGEIRRESYSNRFATAPSGVAHSGHADRAGDARHDTVPPVRPAGLSRSTPDSAVAKRFE